MGGSVGSFFKHALSDAVTIGTLGVIEPEKGRFNVPFTSANARATAKALGNTATFQQARGPINKALDSKESRLGAGITSSIAAGVAGGYAGGPAGSALGVGATAGSIAGGAAAAYAAQQANAAGDAKYQKLKTDEAIAQQEAEFKAAQPKLPETPAGSIRRRRNFSTILTGYNGDTSSPYVQRPSLLGSRGTLG